MLLTWICRSCDEQKLLRLALMTKPNSSFKKPKTILHSPAGKAHRNPMFVFVFVGALFQFDAQRPLFELLFQLPPEYSPRERSEKPRSAPPFSNTRSLQSILHSPRRARRTGTQEPSPCRRARQPRSAPNAQQSTCCTKCRRNTARETIVLRRIGTSLY